MWQWPLLWSFKLVRFRKDRLDICDPFFNCCLFHPTPVRYFLYTTKPQLPTTVNLFFQEEVDKVLALIICQYSAPLFHWSHRCLRGGLIQYCELEASSNTTASWRWRSASMTTWALGTATWIWIVDISSCAIISVSAAHEIEHGGWLVVVDVNSPVADFILFYKFRGKKL